MLIKFALTGQQEGISGIKLAEALERSTNSLLAKPKLARLHPIVNLNNQTSLQMEPPDTIKTIINAQRVTIAILERVTRIRRRLLGPKQSWYLETGYGFGIEVQEIFSMYLYRQIEVDTRAFTPDAWRLSEIFRGPRKTRKQDWEDAQKLLMMFAQELQKNLQITEPQTA